jgi:cystathionine beta-lyase
MLCNPQNPTGRVFTKSELMALGKVCLDRNIIICSDEIHCDLVYPGFKHIPIASISEDLANITITLISASKTFNIAGLKSCAAIITNPDLRELFVQSSKDLIGSVNLLGETAMRSAFESGASWLDSLLVYLQSNRDILYEFVTTELPGVHTYQPEGTFLSWLDFSETGLDDPAGFLLEESRIAVNAGSWFGNEYNQFVRLNFGCPQERLLKGLDKIRKSLLKL